MCDKPRRKKKNTAGLARRGSAVRALNTAHDCREKITANLSVLRARF